jgi:hypothetical protein
MIATVVLAAMVPFAIVDEAFGQQEEPLQLALFHPLQVRDESMSILILRLNLIYGRNYSVKGIDLGIGNHCTGGETDGLQYGLVGLVEGDFVGWQNCALAITKGEFTGYQSGLYNESGPLKGFQLGFINRAGEARGFQLGLVNYAETMYGLQIGLACIINQKESLPVLPIINFSF